MKLITPGVHADDLDPDPTQIYGMPVFAYQGMFIGLPLIYHARWLKYGKYTSPTVMFEAQEGSPKNGDIQMAWSWDLVNWTRTPKREPFIPNGPPGTFDAASSAPRANLCQGRRIWSSIPCWDTPNVIKGKSLGNEVSQAAVGLATMRLDGFCSMRAAKNGGLAHLPPRGFIPRG